MTQARILVVEDDNGLREALVDTLLLGGYECREVDSGERALLALSRQRFDMVISDIQMGGMDGLTLLANIRQQYPQVPVLLMTAYANIDGAVRAMREGAIDYLAKPFSPRCCSTRSAAMCRPRRWRSAPWCTGIPRPPSCSSWRPGSPEARPPSW